MSLELCATNTCTMSLKERDPSKETSCSTFTWFCSVWDHRKRENEVLIKVIRKHQMLVPSDVRNFEKINLPTYSITLTQPSIQSDQMTYKNGCNHLRILTILTPFSNGMYHQDTCTQPVSTALHTISRRKETYYKNKNVVIMGLYVLKLNFNPVPYII